jgi:signal transduction histidine kinase
LYASMFHFATRFPHTKARTKWLVPIVYLLAPAIVASSLLSGLVVQDVQYLGGGVASIQFGPLVALMFAYTLAIGALAAAFLASSLRQVREQVERRRIQYTLAASLCLVVGGLMNAAPLLSGYPIDILAQVAAALLLSYAILRHRLLELGAILREGAAQAIALFAALLLYLGLLITLAFVLHLVNVVAYAAIGTVAAILVAGLYYRFSGPITHALRAKILDIPYDRTQVMERANQLLGQVGEPVDLSCALLDLICTNLGCTKAALWLASLEGHAYLLSSSVGLHTVQANELSFDSDHPFLVKLKTLRHAVDPTQMQELRSLLASLAIHSPIVEEPDTNVAVPLHGPDRMLGFLILGPKQSGSCSQEDLSLLESLGHQAAIALDNAQFQQRLRSLASQLSSADEQERERLATGLRDQIGQPLAALRMRLGALQEPLSSADLAKQLESIRDLADQAIQETRSLSFDLTPPVLYEVGLVAALEWLAERFEERYGLVCTFEDDGQPKPLADDARSAVFWSARELLVNVAKHAHARTVKVSTWRESHHLRLRVEDDGLGFNTAHMEGITHKLGLFSIRQRLAELGGQLELESKRRRGTRATLTAPLDHSGEGSTRN